MRYFSENHGVVVNASGGYAVLERLGFKTQREDVMAKAKKKEKKVALASKSQVLKASEKFRKDVVEKNGKNEAVVSKDSRNQLMEKVKAQGIKNFRVMNKAELAEIVGGAKPERIEAIQKESVERWKSGWGTKKK